MTTENFTTKHVAIIVSAGRTGTMFLGRFLSEVIEDSFSAHEPDVVHGVRELWSQIRIFGFYHMISGRLREKTGLRNLSQDFVAGQLSMNELITKVKAHRHDYYNAIDASLVIESNNQWYGILPAIPLVFPKYRVVCITRDPRTWVNSRINYGGLHDRSDRVLRLGMKRLRPIDIGDAECASRWQTMPPFERLCWEWKTRHTLFLKGMESLEAGRMYRYEDLFLSRNRTELFHSLLDHITSFPDRRFAYSLDEALLDMRVNVAERSKTDPWVDWTHERAVRLDEFCGPLMRRLGYGTEPEWRELIGE